MSRKQQPNVTATEINDRTKALQYPEHGIIGDRIDAEIKGTVIKAMTDARDIKPAERCHSGPLVEPIEFKGYFVHAAGSTITLVPGHRTVEQPKTLN